MKRFGLKVFIGVIILFVVFNGYITGWVKDNNNIESLYLMIFGFIPLSNRNFLFEICLSVINILYVIYIFSQDLQFEIKIMGTYIFTRTNKRKKWISKQYFYKFLGICAYFVIQYIFVFIIGLIYGYEISNLITFFETVIMSFSITTLAVFSMVVLINTLSIFCDYIFSYIFVVMSIVLNIISVSVLMNTNYNWIVKYFPFSQHLIGIKDIEIIDRSINMFSKYIYDYGVNISLLIIFIVISFGISVSLYKITKMDIF
ncbi:hypothetical protein FKF97_12910 [Clostridium perfringens]|uniref:hypothetical protein n=1 Tax=Clostridium perfringens TaxID=1502 RepID=UPI0024BD4EFE|nr:hypothetical protein [Clostridium perfringens]EGT3607297.1 hypothetical protein [Clostridium perfringens]